MPDFAAARRNMVDTQLRTYDVTSHRVLDAVEAVAREAFIPDSLQDLAYSDQAVTVTAGEGAARQLLAPMVLARMLQALDIQPGERLLDCAGGSGYGAALAAALGAKVTAIEASEAMATLMRQSLGRAAVAGVEVVTGDVVAGPATDTDFDVIVMHGAAVSDPAPLLRKLADGGRLAVVMGQGRSGRVMVFTRSGATIGRKAVFDASAPPLPASEPVPAFRF